MDDFMWDQTLSSPVDQVPLNFVDVETTGLDPYRGDRICEVALVQCCGDHELTHFATLVNPGRDISPAAAAVNGITSDMVSGAPAFASITNQVVAMLRTGVVVAHNAPFDLPS